MQESPKLRKESERVDPKNELMFSIVHLSDFHLRDKTQYQTGNILYSLVKDVKTRLSELRIKSAYIAMTGDLTYHGYEEEFRLVEDFISLLNESVDSSAVFLSPGNHDLNRNDKRSLSSFLMEKLMIKDSGAEKTISESFENANDRNDLRSGHKNYYAFLKKIKRSNEENDYLYDLTSITNDDTVVNFISLNSAYLYSDKFPDYGFIGKDQIERAFSGAKKSSLGKKEINVAMFHHPIDRIPDLVQDETRRLISSRSSMVLTGHVHAVRSSVDYVSSIISGRPFPPSLFTSSRCVFDPEDDQEITPGYHIIGVYGNSTGIRLFKDWQVQFSKTTKEWYDDKNMSTYPILVPIQDSRNINESEFQHGIGFTSGTIDGSQHTAKLILNDIYEVVLDYFPRDFGRNDILRVTGSNLVSSKHLTFYYENGGFYVQDAKSLNGSKLNDVIISGGSRIGSKKFPIKDGDILTLAPSKERTGNIKLKFRVI